MTQSNLEKSFADRLVTLADGRSGLRASLHVSAAPVPGEAPQIDFVASDETIDRYDEIISAAGWDLTNYRKNPVFQNAHQYGDIIFTLGKSVDTRVQDGRLMQRIEFATAVNPMARIAYGLYKGGFLNAVSVGFIPHDWEDGNAQGTGANGYRRKFTKQELLELSAVGIPANPNALALGLKSGAIEKSDIEDAFDLLKIRFKGNPSAIPQDKLTQFLASLGLGPDLKPLPAPPKKTFQCGKCGSPNGHWKEFGADCDAGQNYMGIYCPNCGHRAETEKEFCSKKAGSDSNAGAPGIGTYGAQLLHYFRQLK